MTLKNSTGQRIVSVVVEADGNTQQFSDIKPGETRQWTYRIWSDSSYNVTVELENGQILSGKGGYLTDVDSDDLITVTPSGVTVKVNYIDPQTK